MTAGWALAGLVLFIISVQPAPGQESGPEWRLGKESLKTAAENLGRVALSPLSWQGRDLLFFSASLGSTVLLYSLGDDRIQDWVRENRTDGSSDVSQIFSVLGHGGFLTGCLAALYISGEVFDGQEIRRAALLSLESLFVSGAVVMVLKAAVGRERPRATAEGTSFHPLAFKSSFFSFPSGHSCSAFAVATSLALVTDKTWVKALGFVLAGGVALSRVHDDKHWFSDVFAGSLLGMTIARKIHSLHEARRGREAKMSFSLSPGPGYLVLTMAF